MVITKRIVRTWRMYVDFPPMFGPAKWALDMSYVDWRIQNALIIWNSLLSACLKYFTTIVWTRQPAPTFDHLNVIGNEWDIILDLQTRVPCVSKDETSRTCLGLSSGKNIRVHASSRNLFRGPSASHTLQERSQTHAQDCQRPTSVHIVRVHIELTSESHQDEQSHCRAIPAREYTLLKLDERKASRERFCSIPAMFTTSFTNPLCARL